MRNEQEIAVQSPTSQLAEGGSVCAHWSLGTAGDTSVVVKLVVAEGAVNSLHTIYKPVQCSIKYNPSSSRPPQTTHYSAGYTATKKVLIIGTGSL